MITVERLIEMSPQEVFETIANHLIQQKEPAVVPEYRSSLHRTVSRCKYRTEDGKKCAVGCLIPDDLYQEDWEDVAVYDIIERYSNKAEGNAALFIAFLNRHKKLLKQMQNLHDGNYRLERNNRYPLKKLGLPWGGVPSDMFDMPILFEQLYIIAEMFDLDTTFLDIQGGSKYKHL